MVSFVPEYCFDTFDMVTVEFLTSLSIKGVVLDIDNTLEPYENLLPGERVINWITDLKNAGISLAIVSNNNSERVTSFNSALNLPAYFKAGKPFKKNILNAMRDMGTTANDTILIGDQIFTDVWAAHNAKIKAVLVKPIKDKTDLFTRFKRCLEKIPLKKYIKRNETEKRK